MFGGFGVKARLYTLGSIEQWNIWGVHHDILELYPHFESE
jgi:hypothetical protein